MIPCWMKYSMPYVTSCILKYTLHSPSLFLISSLPLKQWTCYLRQWLLQREATLTQLLSTYLAPSWTGLLLEWNYQKMYVRFPVPLMLLSMAAAVTGCGWCGEWSHYKQSEHERWTGYCLASFPSLVLTINFAFHLCHHIRSLKSCSVWQDPPCLVPRTPSSSTTLKRRVHLNWGT